MVNALRWPHRLSPSPPPRHTRTPETTQGLQGYIPSVPDAWNAAEVELDFILRDFELAGLQSHGDTLRAACTALAWPNRLRK